MLCKLSKSQNSINHKSHCCLMGGKFSITLWTVPLRLINLHSVITLTSTLASLLQSRLEGDLSKKLNKKVCSSSNFLLSSKSQAAGCSSCFGEHNFQFFNFGYFIAVYRHHKRFRLNALLHIKSLHQEISQYIYKIK